MNKVIIVLASLLIVGCKTVLAPYEAPKTNELAKLNLPKNPAGQGVLYKIGEIDSKQCASNTTTVYDSSYNSGENVLVRTDKKVYIHINASQGQYRCRESTVVQFEKDKEYKTTLMVIGSVCILEFHEVGANKKKLATESLTDGCLTK